MAGEREEPSVRLERFKLTQCLNLGELFCGPGGIARGARNVDVSTEGKRVRFNHCWANDLDESTCETYRRNVPIQPQDVYCGDVSTFATLKELLRPIDLLAFGFPCNDFSIVGERKGLDGKYGPLYRYGVDFLQFFQPMAFLAENVGGIRSAKDGKQFEQILTELEVAGYDVTPHHYKFEEYGVPQARHRVVIVGVHKDLARSVRFRVPAPTHLHRMNSCREAIEVPPIPENASNAELTRQSPRVVARLGCIKPGENAWTAQLPDELKLNVKGAFISQIYKRLNPDLPAYTITGSGGGGTHAYHWEEPRALTNRERARLQTFPDNHVFCGSKESVRRQVGMAVPPLGATVILNAIVKSLLNFDYPSVNANIAVSQRILF